MPPQYAPAGFPGAVPQYGAMPRPQFAGAPPQMVAPQPKFGAPPQQFAAMPGMPPQFAPQQPVAKNFAAPAAFKQPPMMAMPAPAAPQMQFAPAAAPAPQGFVPSGAEMLQVTVFG